MPPGLIKCGHSRSSNKDPKLCAKLSQYFVSQPIKTCRFGISSNRDFIADLFIDVSLSQTFGFLSGSKDDHQSLKAIPPKKPPIKSNAASAIVARRLTKRSVDFARNHSGGFSMPNFI